LPVDDDENFLKGYCCCKESGTATREWGRVAFSGSCVGFGMARATPTEETNEKVMAAVLDEARVNNALPEVVAAAMRQLRETHPKAAHLALRAMIEATAKSLPADKRQRFLEELLTFLQS